MRGSLVWCAVVISATGNASADCFEKIAVGDPSFIVIEECGPPQRLEREERVRTTPIEVLRGAEAMAQLPQRPRLLERWYYDTSLNAATVIYLEDGGVTNKARLLRQE